MSLIKDIPNKYQLTQNIKEQLKLTIDQDDS
jgi:hypothetical protein